MAQHDIYQAKLNYTLYGQKCVNVFHFRQTTVDGALEPRLLLATQILLNWVGPSNAAATDNRVFNNIAVKKIKPVPTQEVVLNVSAAGTFEGDAYPPNVVVCITLYAATGAHRGLGRTYWVGVPEEAANFGSLQVGWFGTQLVPYVNLFNVLLIDAANAWTWAPALYSPTDGLSRDIVAMEIRPVLRTMRSRTIGQGI